jgi:hypothetical protein
LPCLLLVTLYALRYSLLVSVAAAYGLELQCQQWSVKLSAARPVLNIEKLCVRHEVATIEVRKAKFDTLANHLQTEEVIVELTASHESDGEPIRRLEWQLPESIPSVDLSEISISAPFLHEALSLAISWRSLEEIRITGDVQGMASINEEQLHAAVDWRAEDLQRLLGVSLALQGDMHTNVVVGHEEVAFIQNIDIRGLVQSEDCSVQFSVDGKLHGGYWFDNVRSLLETSEFDLIAEKPGNCAFPDWFTNLTLGEKAFKPASVSRLSLDTQGARVVANASSVSFTASFLLDDSALLQLRKAIINKDDGGFMLEGRLNKDKSDLLDFSTAGNLALDEPDRIDFSISTLKLNIPKLSANGIAVENLKVTTVMREGAGNQSGVIPPVMLRTDAISTAFVDIGSALLRLRLEVSDDYQVTTDLTLNTVKASAVKIARAEQGLTIAANKSLNDIRAKGTSSLLGARFDGFTLQTLPLDHSLQFRQGVLRGDHKAKIEEAMTAGVSHMGSKGHVVIDAQPMEGLNSLLRQQVADAAFTAGTMDLSLNLDVSDVENPAIKGQLRIENTALAYQDYLVEGLEFATELSFKDDRLNSKNGNLSISRVFAGIDIEEISGVLSPSEPFSINAIKGSLLGGSFNVDKLQLSEADQKILLKLNNIDAEQLLALEQQSGIALKARIDAELPVQLSEGEAQIVDGRLMNNGSAVLTIDNNEAFENLKQQQTELGEVLSLLEHLDIQSLESDVKLAKDGWLDLGFRIKGTNPDQQQDVNFNYTHKENIYTLMKALRMGDVIKDKVQKELQ